MVFHHVNVGPYYHHGMVCPWVAYRGDGLQVWEVVKNILNNQLQTAYKGWSSSLVVGQGANNNSSS